LTIGVAALANHNVISHSDVKLKSSSSIQDKTARVQQFVNS